MSDITPYDIAHVIGVLLDRTHTSDGGMIGAHVSDEVLHIDLTPRDGNALHFRAVVVEGETAPIVLERPEELGIEWPGGADLLALTVDGIVWYPRGVDGWEFSPEEAREFAAQLAAMADAYEAAQAGSEGQR